MLLKELLIEVGVQHTIMVLGLLYQIQVIVAVE